MLVLGTDAGTDTNGGGDVWINMRIGSGSSSLSAKGAFANVFLVKEVPSDPSNPGISKRFKDPSHVSAIPICFPLLDHAIISVKASQVQEAELALCYFQSIWMGHYWLCAGLKHMHNFDPPMHANDVNPGNVLLTHKRTDTSCQINGFWKYPSCKKANSFSFRGPTVAECLWFLHYIGVSSAVSVRASFSSFPSCEPDQGECYHQLSLFAIMCGISPFSMHLRESDESPQLLLQMHK
ncbi:hypothetical protein HAX54_021591 [Datura stramonium]|uniref:Uncharacterized protein n=1 Tax=Datura stramonium TaxID=4076 RepID=A0ABS8USY5_DATST|nr:hypothetical protein [Datura stramonium]